MSQSSVFVPFLRIFWSSPLVEAELNHLRGVFKQTISFYVNLTKVPFPAFLPSSVPGQLIRRTSQKVCEGPFHPP